MNFQDIAHRLNHGELQQLAISRQLVEFPNPDTIRHIVSSVNLGLTALYKRFKLKTAQLNLPLDPEIQAYPLDAPDVLKVLQVTTESGQGLPLNDTASEYSCFTPSAKVLKVHRKVVEKSPDLPEAYRTNSLDVEYQANHPRVDWNQVFGQGMESVELELPETHLMALLFFVASCEHMPVGMVNEHHAGNNFYSKYEAEVPRLMFEGMDTTSVASNTRLQRAGFA